MPPFLRGIWAGKMIKLFANFLGRNSALTCSQAVDTDYPLARLVDEARDTASMGTVSTNQYIQFDIDLSTPPCDYFFLDRGHNLDGATIRWVGAADQAFTVPDEIFSHAVSGDGAVFKTFSTETYQHYRLYLESLSVPWSLFGVYFGASASLSKYPAAPCRPNTVRVEKEIERVASGGKRVHVYYQERSIEYEWPLVKAVHWPWFETLETETEHLARPFWLQWVDHHSEPIFFISEDDRLDWEFVNGVDKRVSLRAEEYL